MECLSYCIANSIDLTRLDNYCKSTTQDYVTIRSRDVLKIMPSKPARSTIFAFKNGSVVTWGIKRHQIDIFLDKIRRFAIKPISVLVRDEFSYRISDKTSIKSHDCFDVDCVTLEADMDSDDLKLSLSYGFSQSVKLQYFETIIDALIEKYSPVIQVLSHKGEVQNNRRQIRQIIGEILGAKSEMNLISNFLYHPRYFWKHPTLEEYYTMLERYLHIQRRVNAINHRLDTLNEIFEMFNSYLENRHAHNLEIIIIVLIIIEIIVAALNFHV